MLNKIEQDMEVLWSKGQEFFMAQISRNEKYII